MFLQCTLLKKIPSINNDKIIKSNNPKNYNNISLPAGHLKMKKKIKITSFYTNVGISGACQYLFFAKIDESMKIHDGGGINDEQIEVMYLPSEEAEEFIFDESKAKTPGLMFSFYWFFKNMDKLGLK